jgi:hypothetical protein
MSRPLFSSGENRAEVSDRRFMVQDSDVSVAWAEKRLFSNGLHFLLIHGPLNIVAAGREFSRRLHRMTNDGKRDMLACMVPTRVTCFIPQTGGSDAS